MKVPRKGKAWVGLVVALSGVLVAWMAQRDPEGQTVDATKSVTRPVSGDAGPAAGPDFDFYLLAMSLHPAFCADGHARKPECRSGRAAMLSIHGLWPERRTPGEYPHDCPGPPLDLAPPLERDLAALMPGMADGLHRHEWRKHGTCSGLDDDAYFRHTLELARRVDAVFGDHLTTLAGGSTTADGLRAFADARQPGFGDTVTFHCRTLRGAPVAEPYLVEIRQCLAGGPGAAPRAALSCAELRRRDQGCGRSFHIAAPRRT